jgi:hypothetical protein
MSMLPIINKDRYAMNEIIHYAKGYGCGEEIVLLSLAEGILSASADYFGLTDFSIPKSLWNMSLLQFLKMKCGDGNFVLKTPSYEMAEACAAEMRSIIEAVEEENTDFISKHALDALTWRHDVNISSIDDLDFDINSLKPAYEHLERQLQEYHEQEHELSISITRHGAEKFFSRMEWLAITDDTNKYLKKTNRGRTHNKQWSDIYRTLVEIMVARAPRDQTILAITGCSSLSQLARRIHTPSENDKSPLDTSTIARELGTIDKAATIKRKRMASGRDDDLENQAE